MIELLIFAYLVAGTIVLIETAHLVGELRENVPDQYVSWKLVVILLLTFIFNPLIWLVVGLDKLFSPSKQED